MDAERFYLEVDRFFREHLPSCLEFSIRHHNGHVRIIIEETYDFVISVLAASGANVKATVVGVFGEEEKGKRDIRSCCLKFEFSENCLDLRLVHMMYEILNMKFRDEKISHDVFGREKLLLREYESWLGD
ncbi:MAG: hypothetical protein ACOY82_00760 [Pseudomonadota bacterium]|jgi:hypothetical protein